MSLTILLGDYGSGKTATAKYLAKHVGGVYLDVDILSNDNRATYEQSIIDKLRTILEPNKDYYMDGYPSGCHYGEISPEKLNVDIKYIACIASPRAIQRRQMGKAGETLTELPRTIDEIKRVTIYAVSIALTFSDTPIIADTSTRPVTFWEKKDWIKRWMEINISASLRDTGEYQDIELSDRIIPGLSKSWKTWDRLVALVDFRGKSVLDYGCNYGYFSFKSEEAGADMVIGIDESRTVLNLAGSIGFTRGSHVKFVNKVLKDFDPPDTDIIMALNVLHHLKNDEGVVSRMFGAARTVVLELPTGDLPAIDAVARTYRFGKPVIASSHRIDRFIAIYSKLKPVSIPRKFTYHPRRTAFLKWFYRNTLHKALVIASKVIPHTRIIQSVKRYLWMRLK